MKKKGLYISFVSLFLCACIGTTAAGYIYNKGVVSDRVSVWTAVVDSLRDCDLLFQAAPSANAITDVTHGADGLRIDHVGVFARIDGRPSVIEALPGRGVCINNIDSFMCRSVSATGVPLVIVGRVTSEFDAEASLCGVLRFIGCDYDSLYLPGNREIYCSELVQMSFVDGDGRFVFDAIPMTFRDASGQIPEFWTRFYERHGMAVPEGWPGTNPGEMSRRSNVKIVMRF